MKSMFRFALMVIMLAPSICCAKKFVVGVENLDYMPYYGTVANKYSGMAAEMFTAFEKFSGYEMEISLFPVTRLFDQLKKKKIDAKFPDNAVWQADSKAGLTDLVYSQAVVEFTDAFVTTSDKSVKTVSMVRGFSPPDLNAYKFQQVNSIKAAASMFISNRVDAVYGNIDVIKYTYKHEGGAGDLVILEGSPPSHYYLSTFSTELQAKFNEFLETDQFKEILSKYDLRR